MRYDVSKITKARMLAGLSKSRLARRAEIDTTTVCRIERGLFGKPETIKKIADVLELSMEDLLIDDQERATA